MAVVKFGSAKTVKSVLEFYSFRDSNFVVEFRPNKRRSDGEWICAHRLYPEESWSVVKRIELDGKLLRSLRENPDLERGRVPDIYRVTNEGNFYIGVDATKGKCVVTDRNPYFENLLDVHKCIYLPSSFEKNQTLPGYLTQTILFMELPNPALHCPGMVHGKFFLTPKLVGCNIFVAYDEGLHRFWVLRISGKHPQKPPDLEPEPRRPPKPGGDQVKTAIEVGSARGNENETKNKLNNPSGLGNEEESTAATATEDYDDFFNPKKASPMTRARLRRIPLRHRKV